MSHHLKDIGKNLDVLKSKYNLQNLLTSSDSAEPSDFCDMYNLTNIIKEKTCFKNLNNPSFTDLIILDRPKSFQNSMGIEIGLSDFHKKCATVMKMYYSKQKPIIHYCKFKDFNNDSFVVDIETLLTKPFNEEASPFQAL